MSYHITTGRRVLTLFAAAALTLTACSSGDTTATGDSAASGEPTAADSGEIGFSESFLTDAFQVQLVKQLGEQATAAGVNLLPAVNADGDAAKQNADITTLLGRGVKGLIVVPVDSKAVAPAIDRANKQNVPVVTVDLGADSGKIYMVVRADNVFMGTAACEYMGKQINGEGTVLDLQGDLATQNGQDRSKGFTTCMAEKFPNVKVISKPMNWKPDECATQAQTVLSTEKLTGLFMGSESVCLAGVQQALRQQGKLTKVGDADHIVTVGIDGSKAALEAVREGTLDAVVSQPLDLYAKYGIQYIKDAIEGKTYQAGPTDHDSTIVEVGESLQDLLPSPTVTKENVDDPSLWGNG
ncbi:sugar ABC transporter substrate-binding protein [Streptosporangium sp. NPDC006930]|uniref:sugar ABC transporter substrate-binding protein n=1 Tax=unclassified Streptosporangium TaxID=2632669 RepID=UPI0034392162